MKCRTCGADIGFSSFRAENRKRFREFMALAAVLWALAGLLQLLRVELWPWWMAGAAVFVMSQGLLKWHGSRWVICTRCHDAYSFYGQTPK